MRQVDEASYQQVKSAVKVGLVASIALIITTVVVAVCRGRAPKGGMA